MLKSNETQHLVSTLAQFTGSEEFFRYHSRCLLTEGARYLAEQAGCFWLLDVYASHLAAISTDEYFTCLKFKRQDDEGTVVIDDGNGVVLAEQEIPYTDFPLTEIKLYGCWSGEFWTLMLPSEY